jgi:threonine dehydrogenase-like Zn-dependent dehydrogenase
MIEVALPQPGPDELLVRHDAVGICFSDVKVISAGENHPRIYRNMAEDPVVLGHEVALTIVDVGENLRDQYKIGDRFIIQADIYIDSVSYAYGYEIQGGYSEYNIIDQRVLNGDDGNYLIPVKPETGYAESALNEPWACVERSYTVEYRTTWKENGTVWLTGSGTGIEMGAAINWQPKAIVLDVSDETFAVQVRSWAKERGITLIEDDGKIAFDDIVVLDNDPDVIEGAFERLAHSGVFNVVCTEPVARTVSLDVGRIHYDNLMVVGTVTADLSAAYKPVRTQLKSGGTAWIMGAAGPMGHMHVQRALEMASKPVKVVANDLNDERMAITAEKYAGVAEENGVALVCFSGSSFDSQEAFARRMMEESGGNGFSDIVVCAPSPRAVESAIPFLADNAVMNVFAGLPRGTQAHFDYNLIMAKGVRFTGTSGSSIDDLRNMLELTESKSLSTNSVVAAVAGLEGVADGLRAVADGEFAGKIVIYPQIKPLPVTPLTELAEKLPTVYAKLSEGKIWTNAAEEELLKVMLP